MRTNNIGNLVELRPPRIAMGFVCAAIAAHILLTLPLHPALPAAAALVAVAGFAIMIRAWWLFKRVSTAICPTEVSASLVTHDIFSITRNPMYLGMIMMLAGLALLMGSVPFYIALAGFVVVIDRIFCSYEEHKLLHEFGNGFDSYRKKVRRWL